MAFANLPFEDRIRKAAECGFRNVEMWFVDKSFKGKPEELARMADDARRRDHEHGDRLARRLHRRRAHESRPPQEVARAGGDDHRIHQAGRHSRHHRLHGQ